MRYEHPPIASLLTGAAQEADLVSPGFEQSTAISNRSTLDYTLHCGDAGEQLIVLPGDAPWKRLCSSSVPPDDDDDDVCRCCHQSPVSISTEDGVECITNEDDDDTRLRAIFHDNHSKPVPE